MENPTPDFVGVTGQIVAAFVSRAPMASDQLPAFIGQVYGAVSTLGSTPAPGPVELKPAVSVRASITPEYLICIDDGLKFKSLKRHLHKLGMSPEQYRAKWSLPPTYPMVAPNYSETRSRLAKDNGLGKKPA